MMNESVLLTGANGFLGKLVFRFLSLNFPVIHTIGRQQNDTVKFDFGNDEPLESLKQYDIIIHAAGKAHIVPKTEAERQAFHNVNVVGTANLIKGLEQSPKLPKYFVFISSVAVYGLDKGTSISEAHPLNAKDPYGLSKIQAEALVSEWCDRNGVMCTILRLPLLVGADAPGNLGAMVKGIRKGYYLNIGGGEARKSMVLAEDVAKFILRAAEVGGIYNLTDGYHPNFLELSRTIAGQLQKKSPGNIPVWLAKLMARVGDFLGEKSPFNSYKFSKINADLTFDDSKAREAFGWKPTSVLEGFKID